MSDERQPEPITFGAPSTITATTISTTPVLTGTTATLSSGESLTNSPMAQDNVKFVIGPDGQMIAVQKEPFVWKKFFIGLGIPLILMVVPLILSLIADGMTNWDDEYKYESVQFEWVNGTEYSADYSLNPSEYIEWCDVREDNLTVWYDCQTNGESEMQIYKNTENYIDLIRENGTTHYTENFTLEENQSVDHCGLRLWERDGWYYCKYDDSNPDEKEFILFKETWDDGKENRERVGHWNSTSGIINFDDGEDHGEDIEIQITVNQEVGQWTQETGAFHFDSGEYHGDEIEIDVETIDREIMEEMESSQSTVETLVTISMILCLLAPLVTIALMIYGFAASGGKGMGIGAVVALVLYPIIGFFSFVTAMVASY